MGYRHSEQEILDAAVLAACEEGISSLNYGRLAKRIGIADRSIVYYFPTKLDLITRTLSALGERLQEALANAFGDSPLSKSDLLSRAWPVLASPQFDPIFAVVLEVTGLGAANVAPFDEVGPALMKAWVSWLVPRIQASNNAAARAEAYAIVATIDGLLILRHTCGAKAANLAAVQFGIGT